MNLLIRRNLTADYAMNNPSTDEGCDRKKKKKRKSEKGRSRGGGRGVGEPGPTRSDRCRETAPQVWWSLNETQRRGGAGTSLTWSVTETAERASPPSVSEDMGGL